jgi:hypothetical protein
MPPLHIKAAAVGFSIRPRAGETQALAATRKNFQELGRSCRPSLCLLTL